MDEKFKEAFALLGAASAEKVDMEKKIALLQAAWDAIPEPKTEWGLASSPFAGMGYIEKDRQNFEAAVRHFERSIEVDVENILHSNHFALGVIWLDHLNDPDKARYHFQKASDISERAFKDKDPKYFLFFKGKS